MQIMDLFVSASIVDYALFGLAILLCIYLTQRIVSDIKYKLYIKANELEKLNKIEHLRNCYKEDISQFINSYKSDFYSKIESNHHNGGLFVYWDNADRVLSRFKSDTSLINYLPDREERVALRGFYTESKALIDGITYNNYLLKKYQLLRCKIKSTRASVSEIKEVDTITQEIECLGTQLRQQHNELLNSLKAVNF